MWVFKNKKRYSINEKISYYRKLKKNTKDKKVKEKAENNLKRLEGYKKNKKFGVVLYTKDYYLNKNEPNKKKSRRVVLIGNDNNQAKIIPVKRDNGIICLSGFDKEQRFLKKKEITNLDYNNLYEKNNFTKSNNDKLTYQEKVMLKKKFNI